MTPELRDVLAHAADDWAYIDIRHQDDDWYEEMYALADAQIAAMQAAVADRSTRAAVLRSLGLNSVAMADSDCGWTVSPEVEDAGAWSTAPTGF